MRSRYWVLGWGALCVLVMILNGGGPDGARARSVAPAAMPPDPGCGATWNVVPSPNVGTGNNSLADVAVVAANSVWAVGHYGPTGSARTLVEHWDGTSWAVVPSPNPSTLDNSLESMTVVSPNDIWAVGTTSSSGTLRTLTEHWNGTSWAVVSSPNVGLGNNYLLGVAETATNNVWAVGLYSDESGNTTLTLTEHWNGANWAVVSSPNPSTVSSRLNSVAAVAANDVWASGNYGPGGSILTLIEHWNGTSWAVVPSPNGSAVENSLDGVTATAANDAWAVGNDYISGRAQTLIEHWDGVSWSVIPSANVGTGNNGLSGVAVVTAQDIWTVGNYTSGSARQTLVEHWDGFTWTAVSSPNPGPGDNTIGQVAAVAADDVWTVGAYVDATTTYQTLVEHYSCPPPSPTVTAPPTLTNTSVPVATNPPTGTPAPPTSTATPPGGGPSATPTLSTPPATPGGPAPVVTSTGVQQAPRISNHILVYEDNSTGDWDILAKDLTTQLIYPVYRGPGDQRAPAISGDLVVWQDNRNGKWDVYGRRLNNNSEFPIAVYPGNHTHPRVSGAQVVWEDSQGGGPTGIVTQNLTTGQPFTLSVAGTTNLAPDLNGTLIVWQSTTATSTLGLPAAPAPAAGWQIVGYDLRTGQARPLSSGPGDHTAPSVDNTSVVWVTTLNPAGAAPATTDSTIDGVDIGGGRGTPTPIPVAPLNPGHHVSQPRVKGHQVTFVDETADARGVIVGTSLDTPGAGTVLSAPGRDSRDPDIDDGGFVVWRQTNAPGDTDIYGSGCQPTAYTDVQVTDYFFTPVQWLTCVGALGGYADGSFRPYANTTRGQLAKIIVGAEGWTIDTTGGPHFADVPDTNPFYAFIETAFNHGVISGYSDGSFRWGANVTRGQLSKIVVGAQGWAVSTSGGPHFSDVPDSNPFYPFVETAFAHGIISGYADGTFRVGANATRGQISKIVYIALTTH